LEINPGYFEAYNNRANVYLILNEYQKAIHDFTRAMQLRPDMPMLYYQRSIVYASAEQYASALSDARRAESLGLKGMEKYFAVLKQLIQMSQEPNENQEVNNVSN